MQPVAERLAFVVLAAVIVASPLHVPLGVVASAAVLAHTVASEGRRIRLPVASFRGFVPTQSVPVESHVVADG